MENVNIWKWSINRRKALILLIYGLVALTYISGVYQKWHATSDNRMKFHAIPVAISTLYQGHKHDYRGWRSTEIPFRSIDALNNEFLMQQIKGPVDVTQGHYYLVADDR